MMKRFLAFLLSAVLLAGCSSGQSAFDTLRKTGTAGREILKGAGAIASSLLAGENKDTAAEQEMTEIVIENPPEETGEKHQCSIRLSVRGD